MEFEKVIKSINTKEVDGTETCGTFAATYIIDINSENLIRKWYGTQLEYDAFIGDRSNIEFNIIEE